MSTMTTERATPTADLTALAATDRRVARMLAGAERDRLAAAAQDNSADAGVARQLALAEGRQRLDAQRDEQRAERSARREQRAEERRERRQTRRDRRRKATATRIESWTTYARANSVSVYSATVYGLAVGGAVYGQISAATEHGLPVVVGLGAAVAIEGFGLSMALTAHQLRMTGERAVAARALTWAATAIAVCINYFGHAAMFGYAGDQVKAIGLSLLSAIGIVVWEVRSAAKHRPALRAQGLIADPPERFGWRRWLRHFPSTFRAWSVDVRNRVSPGAAALIAQADADRVARAARKVALQVAQDRRLAEQRAARRVEKTRARVVDLADLAARRAARKGDAGVALAALVQLAHTGTAPVRLALADRPTPRPDVESVIRESVPAPAAHVESAAAAEPVGAESAHERESAREVESAHVGTAGGAESAHEVESAYGRESAGEPDAGESAPAGGEPVAPVSREPRRRIVAAAQSVARRTVTAQADSESALVGAYALLMTELGRTPSGQELADRAGCSKAKANRWKATREVAA